MFDKQKGMLAEVREWEGEKVWGRGLKIGPMVTVEDVGKFIGHVADAIWDEWYRQSGRTKEEESCVQPEEVKSAPSGD